ncbi:hypothetical protein Kpho02_69400 [Kitasatospora phosalacinea]|uniref:Uncharacterized protein n=1 Tax=Kitasatospora phosalacinea TaxID=2065 RepID=A0A9W6V6V9_9ACTN|nr:hypothetical protein Kpho02_69400 [Kitasatospora phosalacinea]
MVVGEQGVFAGPGVYRGGEQGSPVVAYHVLASALRDRPGRVRMVLVAEDPRRKAESEQRIAAAARSRQLRSGRLDVRIGQGSCHPVLLEGLTRTDSMRRPMFVLLDGFGARRCRSTSCGGSPVPTTATR